MILFCSSSDHLLSVEIRFALESLLFGLVLFLAREAKGESPKARLLWKAAVGRGRACEVVRGWVAYREPLPSCSPAEKQKVDLELQT